MGVGSLIAAPDYLIPSLPPFFEKICQQAACVGGE